MFISLQDTFLVVQQSYEFKNVVMVYLKIPLIRF